jgi:hypothetical protein
LRICRKKYSTADIVIDQVLCPGAGKFATECLAMGLVVLSRMAYNQYPDFIPEMEKNPIIDCSPDTIYDELKKIILNHELRSKLALEGPKYVRRNLNTNHFCERLMNMLYIKEEPCELFPSFFRNTYLPEKDKLDIYNSFTRMVSTCDWYDKFVPKGEREGLIF